MLTGVCSDCGQVILYASFVRRNLACLLYRPIASPYLASKLSFLTQPLPSLGLSVHHAGPTSLAITASCSDLRFFVYWQFTTKLPTSICVDNLSFTPIFSTCSYREGSAISHIFCYCLYDNIQPCIRTTLSLPHCLISISADKPIATFCCSLTTNFSFSRSTSTSSLLLDLEYSS